MEMQMTAFRWLALLIACTAMSGCADAPSRGAGGLFETPAERRISSGVRSYENGHYREAAQLLQAGLDAGVRDKTYQVNAHKYLAFIHCISDRDRQCRDEFRKVLDVDPSFELDSTEAGHPIWGPAFRSVKARR
jgi:Tfp pilus assembly protein PilF